jgi:predicted NUDIX family NTP pyrophosphohydrolase
MTSRVSAGILLFRRAGGGAAPGGAADGGGTPAGGDSSMDAGLEVLLGHPGGPFFAGRDLGAWSIPKGEAEPGEDFYDVARREFEEETGHTAPAPPAATPIPLGSIVQKGGKTVHAWALEGDLDPADAVSNTFSMRWPPLVGAVTAFPEIDRVAWFAPHEARLRLKATQVPFVDRLEEAIRAS